MVLTIGALALAGLGAVAFAVEPGKPGMRLPAGAGSGGGHCAKE